MHWSISLMLAVALGARGIRLGRPVTAAHAAVAGLLMLAGLSAHLLASPIAAGIFLVAAVAALFAPMASRPDPGEVARIWELIRVTHGDPLAPFAMNSQKSHFFNADGTAAVAYRTRLGLAVVSGDPIGSLQSFPELADGFVAMCRSRGWRIVVLGCSGDGILLWRNATGANRFVRAVPIGCDVEVDVPQFAMTGRRFRNLRQAVARSHNHGITTEVVGEQELDETLTAELVGVLYASHRGARLERGFSMILDAAIEGRYPGVMLMIGRDAGGRIQGFHRYLVAGDGSDVTLDVPWRRPGAPNGLDERLTVEMIDWCKAVGTKRLSLAFAAFPAIFDTTDRTPAETFYYYLIRLGGPLIRLEPLYRYLRKFHALGQRRYVLVSLPLIPLALMVLLTLEFQPRRRTLLPIHPQADSGPGVVHRD